MGRRFAPLELEEVERAALASRRSTAQGLALRARIILACAEGEQSKIVAASLGIDPDTVGKWRRRFAEHRLDGLRDEPRSGTPRTVEDARIEAMIVRTLETKPSDATHWSSRGMARASRLSVSTVQRIWRAFGLQPHRLDTFKLSTDPDFVAKVRDVVGSTWSRPSAQSYCASMRSRRFRRWTAASPCHYPCGLVGRRAVVTTTSATAPHHCLPPSTSQPAGSSQIRAPSRQRVP
jgi:transposase